MGNGFLTASVTAHAMTDTDLVAQERIEVFSTLF